MLDTNKNPIENAFAYGILRNAVFKSFANTTETIVIHLGYTATSESPSKDLAVTTLFNAARSEPLGKLSLGYEITTSIALISWTGWRHRIQGQMNFDLEEFYPDGDSSQLLKLLDAMFKK